MTLKEMVHKQQPISMHCENIPAAGIANNTMKKERSWSMEMRSFWIADQVKLGRMTCSGTQDKKIWLNASPSTLMINTA